MKSFLLLIIGTTIGYFSGVTLTEEDHISQDKLISDQVVDQMKRDQSDRDMQFLLQQNQLRMQSYQPTKVQTEP